MNFIRRRFTLMEVLLAMGAFLIGAIPMVGLLTSTSMVHSDNRRRAMVSLLAMRQLQEINQFAWDETHAASNSRNSSLQDVGGSGLTQDREFPELYHVTEVFTITHSSGMAISKYITIGVAHIDNPNNNRSRNILDQGQTYTVTPGSSLTGCKLSDEQFKRFNKGGFLCVRDRNGDRIYKFDNVTYNPVTKVYTINTLFHRGGNTSTGKVIFLEHAFITPLFMKNKLWDLGT